MPKPLKLPKEVEAALEMTGLPWRVVKGGRHRKVILNGRFVGILPLKANKLDERSWCAVRNLIAQIRRGARN